MGEMELEISDIEPCFNQLLITFWFGNWLLTLANIENGAYRNP